MHTQEPAYQLNFNVLPTDNVEKMKNAVVANVFAYHHSSSTTEMETDAEVHVINSDAGLMLNVHLQIHHNVYVKPDSLETLWRAAVTSTNAEIIHAVQTLDASTKKEVINVNALVEPKENHTLLDVPNLVVNLNVAQIQNALDNFHAKMVNVIILAQPCLVESMLPAYQKTMQHGADVIVVIKKTQKENVLPNVLEWDADKMLNVSYQTKDQFVFVLKAWWEIHSLVECAHLLYAH